MGFALNLALRYMRSRKRSFVSVSTIFAILGVALGTAALAAVMSVTGGFRAEFQKKVLGVNAHVMVLRASFRDYREVMEKVRRIPDVIGVAPFVLNPMMITHAGHTATGVLLKGVDPDKVGSVLDLPEQMVAGSLEGLRSRLAPLAAPGAVPASMQLEPELDAELGVAPSQPGSASGRSAGAPSPVPEPLAAAAPRAEPAAAAKREPRELAPGSIVPEGGYSSELPSDDELPAELDPDPCQAADSELPGIVLGSSLL